MARKTATIVIKDGRDKGKQFLITEMPATEGATLSFQVFQLLAESGIDLEIKSLDPIGILKAVIRALSTLPRADFEYYRDWLFKHIQWQSPTDVKAVRKVILSDRDDSDIEDVMTILELMQTALKLNLEDVFTGLKQRFLSQK